MELRLPTDVIFCVMCYLCLPYSEMSSPVKWRSQRSTAACCSGWYGDFDTGRQPRRVKGIIQL